MTLVKRIIIIKNNNWRRCHWCKFQRQKEREKLLWGVTTQIMGKRSRPGLFWRGQQSLYIFFFQDTLAGTAQSSFMKWNQLTRIPCCDLGTQTSPSPCFVLCVYTVFALGVAAQGVQAHQGRHSAV